jgi:RNA polymerase sigma factor for flagellar operon FliA
MPFGSGDRAARTGAPAHHRHASGHDGSPRPADHTPPRAAEPKQADRTPRTPPHVVEDWNRYKTTGSLGARNRLVSHYMANHVRPIAIRIRAGLPKQVELDDLMQQGYLGLIDAMDRFDPDRETRFETFSRSRVFGAIQDYLRSIDPVPRLTRIRAKQLQAEIERFRLRHGRRPTDDELRMIINVAEPLFQRYLDDGVPAMIVPFSSVHPDGEQADDLEPDAMDAFIDRQHGPVRAAERQDLRRWLVRGLTRRDRLIIILYYYEHMTMREVGAALGISESRVSQRLESILACLKSRFHATGAEREFIFT